MAELRVEAQANLDGLTGIANRRAFDDFLNDEWRQAQRAGQPVSMALIEIEFFKAYYDNHGHLGGDECLRRVGKELSAFSRRPGDFVARYGGEEFAVILGGAEPVAAGKITESIRAAIQSLDITHDYATQARCITVSAGVATQWPNTRADLCPSSLIEAADKALYEAKDSGRNGVRAGQGLRVADFRVGIRVGALY